MKKCEHKHIGQRHQASTSKVLSSQVSFSCSRNTQTYINIKMNLFNKFCIWRMSNIGTYSYAPHARIYVPLADILVSINQYITKIFFFHIRSRVCGMMTMVEHFSGIIRKKNSTNSIGDQSRILPPLYASYDTEVCDSEGHGWNL